MTRRLGCGPLSRFGRHVRPVAQIVAELGVSWSAVMGTVAELEKVMIKDPEWIGAVAYLGVD